MGRRPEIDFQNNLKYHALHESYPSIGQHTLVPSATPNHQCHFQTKKKEMKLTAAQRDWDTLYQLVVSFIRLPLAWIQKQVSACCFCFCLELGLGQPFLASWSLVPKTFSVQLMFFFLPPFVNVLLPVCPREKKAKIIRRRSQIKELTLLLPAS